MQDNRIDTQILDFLIGHRICALTTLLQDGSPHAAAIHFSYNESPFEFYFSTKNTTKKCEALLDGQSSKASVVVGLSDEEWITLQMDGTVKSILDPAESEKTAAIHYARHPHAATRFKNDPSTLFLHFTPKWWRYTDFNTKPPTILSSES